MLNRQQPAYSAPIDSLLNLVVQQFVAGEDPLQTSAINLAQLRSLESYSPYLTAAQAGLTHAGTDVGAARGDISAARTAVGGLGALTGSSSISTFYVSVSTTSD